MPKITEDQLDALNKWHGIHGHHWKVQLRRAWETGFVGADNMVAELQHLRNTLGPSWLVRFNLKKANRDAAEEVKRAIEDQLDDFNWVGSRHHY